MRISDWSSDVCSSDLNRYGFLLNRGGRGVTHLLNGPKDLWTQSKIFERHVILMRFGVNSSIELLTIEFGSDHMIRTRNVNHNCPSTEIGRASCRQRVCQYV